MTANARMLTRKFESVAGSGAPAASLPSTVTGIAARANTVASTTANVILMRAIENPDDSFTASPLVVRLKKSAQRLFDGHRSQAKLAKMNRPRLSSKPRKNPLVIRSDSRESAFHSAARPSMRT
jgi:hypothetical protein